jgi:hypothetical protein
MMQSTSRVQLEQQNRQHDLEDYPTLMTNLAFASTPDIVLHNSPETMLPCPSRSVQLRIAATNLSTSCRGPEMPDSLQNTSIPRAQSFPLLLFVDIRFLQIPAKNNLLHPFILST